MCAFVVLKFPFVTFNDYNVMVNICNSPYSMKEVELTLENMCAFDDCNERESKLTAPRRSPTWCSKFGR